MAKNTVTKVGTSSQWFLCGVGYLTTGASHTATQSLFLRHKQCLHLNMIKSTQNHCHPEQFCIKFYNINNNRLEIQINAPCILSNYVGNKMAALET